ncbi:hypothetical protein [Paraflavitalea speifideaquila]|uniref:hypothetical protein n=1 Tax=Paraflavitalea speifideaquila TaxID=3076558 RepID=UPI0028ED0080|nr:hypothetical protein [Paraflavitalea speifideiaquila]
MTIKEAILKSLDDLKEPANYVDVYQHIVKHNYYNFGATKNLLQQLLHNSGILSETEMRG